jgi:uncharacterized protein YneF (UPF0154 family)
MIGELLAVWFVAGLLSLGVLGLIVGMWIFRADWREEIKEDWNK